MYSAKYKIKCSFCSFVHKQALYDIAPVCGRCSSALIHPLNKRIWGRGYGSKTMVRMSVMFEKEEMEYLEQFKIDWQEKSGKLTTKGAIIRMLIRNQAKMVCL